MARLLKYISFEIKRKKEKSEVLYLVGDLKQKATAKHRNTAQTKNIKEPKTISRKALSCLQTKSLLF